MNWSDEAWKKVIPIYERITRMPFIVELMNGTLALEKFQFYIEQDSFYLEHFSRSLAIIAARIQTPSNSLAFIRFAEGALVVEKSLHESYFRDFDIKHRGKMQPTCHHYVHYLKSTASLECVEVAVAAVLPCFKIYKEVGNYIYHNQQPINNPYKKWIDTYAGEEFGLVVKQAIAIADSLAAQITLVQQQLMTDAFINASQLEYEFWASAYKVRKW